MAQDLPQELTPRERWTYGVGDLGLNVFWQGATFFFLFYFTDVLGMSPEFAGTLIALAGFIDAATDPVMGAIADRTRSRWGRYRPYIIFGAIPLVLVFWGIFALPVEWTPVWLIVTFVILYRICYTIVSIPYSGLGARLSFSYAERTRLSGIRMMCAMSGGLLVIGTVSVARMVLEDHLAFAIAIGVSCFFAAGVIIWSGLNTAQVRPRDSVRARRRVYGVGDVLQAILMNRPYLILMAALILLTFASKLFNQTLLYRFDHLLDAKDIGSWTLTLMAIVPLLSVPLWVAAYLHLGKRLGFAGGCAIAVMGFMTVYLSGMDAPYITMLGTLIVAAGLTSFAVGLWAILPDTIDYWHATSGKRIESGLIGLASAIQKITLGLSGLAMGYILKVIQYSPDAGFQEESRGVFHMATSLVPAGLFVLCLCVFLFYPLSEARHRALLDKLD